MKNLELRHVLPGLGALATLALIACASESEPVAVADAAAEVADATAEVADVAAEVAAEVADEVPDVAAEVAVEVAAEVATEVATEVADIDAESPLNCTPRTLASGRAAGTNALMPGGTRVRAATSTDGVHWSRLAAPIADQVATPTLARTADGRPLLYVTAHKVDGAKDGTAVAIGSADGRTWTHCDIARVGFPGGLLGADPDIVARPGGGYRLFVTGSVGAPGPGTPRLGVHWADSEDGLTFTYGGVAFERAEGSVVDSMTFVHDGVWHMYTLQPETIRMAHGTSTDGKSFTWVGEAEQRIGTEPYVLSHQAEVAGAPRIFGFGPRGEVIRAFDVGAGAALSGDPTPLLGLADGDGGDLQFVKDPAVTRLTDGSYLMVYATALP